MDYATLIADKSTLGSIANWVNYSDAKLPVAEILHEAQAFINDNLRLKKMVEVRTLALPAGSVSVASPSDLLSVVNMQDPYRLPIKPLDLKSIMDRQAVDSSGAPVQGFGPTRYGRTKSTFEFDIAPSTALTLRYSAYFAPPTLGSSQQTNLLTDEYPHLLRPAILAFAADFLNDDAKYTRYMNRYTSLAQQAMQSDDMDQFGMQVDMDYSEANI